MKQSSGFFLFIILLSTFQTTLPLPKLIKRIEQGLCNRLFPELIPYFLSAYTYSLSQLAEDPESKEALEKIATIGLLSKVGIDGLRLLNNAFKLITPDDENYDCKMGLRKAIDYFGLTIRELQPYVQIGMTFAKNCEEFDCDQEKAELLNSISVCLGLTKISCDIYRIVRELNDGCYTCSEKINDCYWDNEDNSDEDI